MSAIGGTVAFRSPRGDRSLFVKVSLPPDFDETQYRKVDELAKQVYEIANGTGPATFKEFPSDVTALVAIMVAQQCCADEDEWNRVTDLGRATLFLTYGDVFFVEKFGVCIPLNGRSMAFVKEKENMCDDQ